MSKIVTLKQRIAVVRTIQKTAQALSLTSFAWLARSKQNISQAQMFLEVLGLSPDIISGQDHTTHNRVVLLWGPQRGFCGSYSHTLFAKAHEYALQFPQATWIPIGHHARSWVARHDLAIPAAGQKLFEFHRVTATNYPLFKQTLAAVLSHLDPETTIDLLYMHAKNVLIAEPQIITLPRTSAIPENLAQVPYEQDQETLHRCLHILVQQGLLTLARAQSVYAEHAARATAMQAANSNAQETLSQLALAYHKARQAKITNDIIELASGMGS